MFLAYRPRGNETQDVRPADFLNLEDLDPDEQRELLDAIAALTAVSEPAEFILDQEQYGQVVSREWIIRLRVQGAEPASRIAKIVGNHPGVSAILVRNRLYVPFPGNVGLISRSPIEWIND
jgi:hypothetical protein